MRCAQCGGYTTVSAHKADRDRTDRRTFLFARIACRSRDSFSADDVRLWVVCVSCESAARGGSLHIGYRTHTRRTCGGIGAVKYRLHVDVSCVYRRGRAKIVTPFMIYRNHFIIENSFAWSTSVDTRRGRTGSTHRDRRNKLAAPARRPTLGTGVHVHDANTSHRRARTAVAQKPAGWARTGSTPSPIPDEVRLDVCKPSASRRTTRKSRGANT